MHATKGWVSNGLIAVAISLLLTACGGRDKDEHDASVPSGASTTAKVEADELAEKKVVNDTAAPDLDISAVTAQLNANPLPTLFGRWDACLADDRVAFAGFYAREDRMVFNSDPSQLKEAFMRDCRDFSGQPVKANYRRALDGKRLMASVDNRGRNSPSAIWRLCLRDDRGGRPCEIDGPVGVALENGAVVAALEADRE